MKVVCLVQPALALLVAGCASSSFYLTPRLAPALTHANLHFEIKHFNARTNKGFLEIEVRIAHEDTDYKEDFDLELADASAICAALANSDAAFRYDWQEMELTFWSEYGNMLRWRNTVGFIKVSMSREALLVLREQNAPASEYPKSWRFVAGSKAGPSTGDGTLVREIGAKEQSDRILPQPAPSPAPN